MPLSSPFIIVPSPVSSSAGHSGQSPAGICTYFASWPHLKNATLSAFLNTVSTEPTYLDTAQALGISRIRGIHIGQLCRRRKFVHDKPEVPVVFGLAVSGWVVALAGAGSLADPLTTQRGRTVVPAGCCRRDGAIVH